MAYPLTPVAFQQLVPGENRSDVANLLGGEIQAIETALLHPAAQTTAPIRLRGGGTQIEWGPTAVGLGSTLGSTGGKSYLGLGCEAGSVPGTFTTRAIPGMVFVNDGSGGLLIQAVPLKGLANQAPVTRLALSNTGVPTFATPVVVIMVHPAYACSSGAWSPMLWQTTVTDPFHLYTGDSAGNFAIPTAFGGLYLVIVSMAWAANATGVRGIAINTPTNVQYDYRYTNLDGGTFSQQIVFCRQIADGSVFAPQFYQSSGGVLGGSASLRLIKLH